MQAQVNKFLWSATPMAVGALAGYAAQGSVGAVFGAGGVHWASKLLQYDYLDLGPEPVRRAARNPREALVAAVRESVRAVDVSVAATKATLCAVQASVAVGLGALWAPASAAACVAGFAGAAAAERLWGVLLER